MRDWEQELPEDLGEVAKRLRSERPVASALELDRMKMRALAGSGAARHGRNPLRNKSLVALIAGTMVLGGTGGTVLAIGNGASNSNATQSQYGAGCGAPNQGDKTGPPAEDKGKAKGFDGCPKP